MQIPEERTEGGNAVKECFARCKKLHIWLGVLAGFLAAYYLLRRSGALMNALADFVTTPYKRAMGRLCSLTKISVAEVFYITLGAVVIFFLADTIRRVIRGPRRWETVYRAVLTLLCGGLTFYAGLCLLWGINYHTDTLQEKTGIYARQGTAEEVRLLTEEFAAALSEAADDVPRDGSGVFSADRQAILQAGPAVYAAAFDAFPALTMDDVTPKAFSCSRFMTAMDFTGFYFPYTGEANLNMDCPEMYLPATVIHEMTHQRQVASEQECNFAAIAVSAMSSDSMYRYSGLLMGYVHLSNALYREDREAYAAIRDQLPDVVIADLRANSAYWNAHHTAFTDATQKVYDSFIKTNGDPNGTKSYGMVVDMLLSYYLDGEGDLWAS